jgi:type III pantothenate kinase
VKALLLDIGNSRIKWGVLVDESIRQTGHVRQSAIRERGLAALTRRLPHDVDVVLACNVAGTSIETRLSAVIGLHCDCDVRFARSQAHAYGITNGYRQSRRLGVDRWVAMIGARALCETSCIVVDAGTAITIDALDDDGQHLGGQILPGIMLMTEALASSTSDLPKISGRVSAKPGSLDIFSATTSGAISQGVIGAAVGAVERATRVLREDGFDPTIYLTGGDAPKLLNCLDEEAEHCPHLVLQGLARILED